MESTGEWDGNMKDEASLLQSGMGPVGAPKCLVDLVRGGVAAGRLALLSRSPHCWAHVQPSPTTVDAVCTHPLSVLRW